MGISSNEIIFNKIIQNMFLENKCKISEKQLEQLANLSVYIVKKSQGVPVKVSKTH